MKKNLNIGLVGYKFMGKAHSNGYSRINMFFDTDNKIVLKSICGRDEKWLKKSADQFGFESYNTDWRQMVARDDIDVVDITTPSNYHAEIALVAAENKKHIFCEKPLALTLSDARAMLSAVEKNNVKHQIGFNYRFAPAIILAKKLIDEGKIGKIYHYRATYLQDYIVDPNFPFVWRLDKKVCGSGSLGDLGAHIIDLGRFLVGEFEEVIGMEKTFCKKRPMVERMEGLSGLGNADAPLVDIEVDDATVMMIEFKNGAIGTIEATRNALGHDNDMVFEINGSKGSIRYRFERMNELEYYCNDDEREVRGFRNIATSHSCHKYLEHWWPAGHPIGYEHTFVHELYEFTNSIINDTPTTPNFNDGVKCSQIIEAVEQSIKNRCWVDVDSL